MPLSTINKTPPFVLSMGEPAGIGPEIILKAWAERDTHQLPAFFVTGSHYMLQETAKKMGLDMAIQVISSAAETKEVFPKALPIFNIDNENSDFEFGVPSAQTAPLVIKSIERAAKFIFNQDAAGLITAPIQKSILYDAGFPFPGHTEYLGQLCKAETSLRQIPIMMLVSKDLRVVPLTIHIALSEVPRAITPDLIKITYEKIHEALQADFGLTSPRIAVAGLNPHGGEGGTMGLEELQIIAPTLRYLRDQGMAVQGPLSADTMFHPAARATYDAALCMYHDQALIPIKTLDFEGGVNVTIGLPLIRTSPDHGTALNIAGQNLASPKSMINAIKMAEEIYHNRQKMAHKTVTNPKNVTNHV